jgi:hypothetical protein
MRGLFTGILFFIMILNIGAFIIGVMGGSMKYKRDCTYKMKRFNYVIPGHKVGCASAKYFVEGINWLNEDIE